MFSNLSFCVYVDDTVEIDSKGIVRMKSLKVESFEGDIDVGQHKLTNVHVDGGKITNTEINVKEKGEQGKLLIVDNDDKVVVSEHVSSSPGRFRVGYEVIKINIDGGLVFLGVGM